jgi:hypothetical protein
MARVEVTCSIAFPGFGLELDLDLEIMGGVFGSSKRAALGYILFCEGDGVGVLVARGPWWCGGSCI